MGSLTQLYCHRARSARSTRSKNVSGGTRLRCASATTPRQAAPTPRRSSAQRDSLQSVGGSGDVRFNFVMSKGSYGPICERVRYPVRACGDGEYSLLMDDRIVDIRSRLRVTLKERSMFDLPVANSKREDRQSTTLPYGRDDFRVDIQSNRNRNHNRSRNSRERENRHSDADESDEFLVNDAYLP